MTGRSFRLLVMKRWIAFAISLFALFALLYIGAASMGWTRDTLYRRWIEDVRAGGGSAPAAALLVGLLAADLALPVPSSVLMTLAGALFGVWRGTAVALTGAIGSAALGFGLCRRFGRRAFDRLIGAETARVEAFFRRYGVWAVLLSRSVPMLTEVVSCLAGLSRMPPGRFFALSLAGTFPVCWVYAWAGHRAGAEAGAGWAVLIAFALPALGFAAVRIARPAPDTP